MTRPSGRSPRVDRALAVVAALGGLLAVVAGSPTRPVVGTVDVADLASIVEREEDHVTAPELAKWIRDNKPLLTVLDVRSDAEYGEFHIPGAKRAALTELARMPVDTNATYVLYSEGGTHAAQGWFLLRARGVDRAYFLRGGLYEWLEQIMNPKVPSTMPQVERDSIRALTLWFGGTMEVVDTLTPSILDRELAAPRARDTREAIGKIRRRAC